MGRKTVYNNITSFDKIENINPKNLFLLNDFAEYLESIGRSPATIKNYKSDLFIFFCWCEEELDNKYFINITKREFVRFQNHAINVWMWSPNRIRTVKGAISSLSNYIENILDDEIPEYKSVIKKVESPPRRVVRDKTVYSEEEIEALLNALVERGLFQRACFIALGAYSGRRKSELCRFKVSDFADDKLVCDGALYKSELIKTKGRGGGKYIPCYVLAKRFKPYLDMWLEDRKKRGIESEWLFPAKGDNTNHIATSTVDGWKAQLSKITGKEFYPHALRHAYTTSLSKAGIPDGVIQAMVAWESADMVRLYDDTPKDEMIAEYFRDGEIASKKAKSIGEI